MKEGIQTLKSGLLFAIGKGNTNDFGGGWVSSEIIETHSLFRTRDPNVPNSINIFRHPNMKNGLIYYLSCPLLIFHLLPAMLNRAKFPLRLALQQMSPAK